MLRKPSDRQSSRSTQHCQLVARTQQARDSVPWQGRFAGPAAHRLSLKARSSTRCQPGRRGSELQACKHKQSVRTDS